MSFVLNLTSRGATGREIVRSRQVDGDVVTIGRDPGSDIHLTDLEVTRQHAEIRRVAPDRVAVRALAAIPLIVDGRSTEEAEILAAQGGEIRIGETRIALSAGDDGAVAIAVTRDAAPLEGADDASKRFSIAGRAFGKRAMAWTFALVILAIFLIWPIWSFNQTPAKLTDAQMASDYHHAGESWSPGPLSRAHASLERNCKVCHVQAFVAVPDTACKACHTKMDDHADPRRLMLARPQPDRITALKLAIAETFGRSTGRCVDCHLEHSGPTPMPAARVSCTSCHADLKAKLPDTKLGDASDFARNHPQFSPLVMTTPGDYPRFTPVSLDDPKRTMIQNSGLKFPHAMHMSRFGGVAKMQSTLGRKPLDCVECHVSDDKRIGFKPVSMLRNCEQCHSLDFDRVGGTIRKLPHGDAARTIGMVLAAGNSSSVGPPSDRRKPGQIQPTPIHYLGGNVARVLAIFSPRGACYDCHTVVPPGQPGGLNFRIVPVREQLRFMPGARFNHAAHSTSTCASCHGEALTTNDPRVLMLPGIATCRECHGGEKARLPRISSTCEMCHGYHHVSELVSPAKRVGLTLWATPPSALQPRGAKGGRGAYADSPDFRFASWVRAERPRGNERAPP